MLVCAPQFLREVREVMGDDPFVYGVHANKKAIDFIQQISVEQGLTKTKQPLNEIFPESVITADMFLINPRYAPNLADVDDVCLVTLGSKRVDGPGPIPGETPVHTGISSADPTWRAWSTVIPATP